MSIIIYSGIIIFFFIVVYFFIISKYEKIILHDSSCKISYITEHQAAVIDMELSEISNMSKLLQNHYQFLFQNSGLFKSQNKQIPISFSMASNGVFYKNEKTGSGVYFSSDTVINDHNISRATLTELFDNDFINIINENRLIARAYFNSWDNICRIYPDLPGRYNSFGPIFHSAGYSFYYAADSLYNPDRVPVWNSVYTDPAGSGKIISCLVPVYNNDFLEGVLGFDINIRILADEVLENKTESNIYSTMIIDQYGTVIAMDNNIAGCLTQNTDDQDSEAVDIFITSNDFFQAYLPVFLNNKETYDITLFGKSFIVKTKTITENNWKVVTFIDKEELLSDIIQSKHYILILLIILSFSILIINIPLILLLNKNIRTISENISSPIYFLSSAINSGLNSFDISKYESNILEIDDLILKVSNMIQDFKSNNDRLIQTELMKIKKEKEAEAFKKMSITDTLTKLYNRLYIDNELENKYRLFKRYKNIFSIIILDIDDFKLINDKYGHLVGDKVLIQISGLLKNNSRATDCIGRWGGEEFIIITPDSAKKTFDFTEKLRMKLESVIIDSGIICTASFGIAQITDFDTVETLLNRADTALYSAKRTGKNKCVMDPVSYVPENLL